MLGFLCPSRSGSCFIPPIICVLCVSVFQFLNHFVSFLSSPPVSPRPPLKGSQHVAAVRATRFVGTEAVFGREPPLHVHREDGRGSPFMRPPAAVSLWCCFHFPPLTNLYRSCLSKLFTLLSLLFDGQP